MRHNNLDGQKSNSHQLVFINKKIVILKNFNGVI